MTATSDFYWLAATAQAAYANLDEMTIDQYIERLQLDVQDNALFSAEQAEFFAAEWRVVNQLSDSENHWFEGDPNGGGFSATLFQRNSGNKDYVLAFRGTMGNDDLLLTDLGDIVADGMASSQIIDLYNYVMALRTSEGSTFQQARRESAPAELQGFFYSLGASERMSAVIAAGYYWDSGKAYKIVFDTPAAGLGKIQVGDKITATGHSLGGHLASAFTRLFPEFSAEALTINGAGFGLQQENNVNIFFNQLAGASTRFEPNLITNLYGDKNPNVITQDFLLKQPGGEHLPLYIEQNWPWESTFGHGSGQMVQSAAVYDLFIRLDATLQAASISEVLARITPLLEASSHRRADSLEQTVDGLRHMFGFPVLATTAIDNEESFYKAVSELLSDSLFQELSGCFTLNTAPVSASAARESFGSFLALQYLTPFSLEATDANALTALEGANSLLAQLWAADRSLSPEERIDGMANFSDAYLQDRAAMLESLVAGRLVDSTARTSYAFQDMETGQYTITDQASYTTDNGVVVFGRLAEANIGDQAIYGSIKNDRLYGGTREDLIHGGELNDHLYGMAGDDTLKGETGNDYLEGGSGADRLFGGKGNDTLVGGNGNDRYEFATGDGHDVLIDAGGLGELWIDGAHYTLAQHLAPNADSWHSQDGKVKFLLSGSDLLVLYGQDDSILIRDYQPGALGLELDNHTPPQLPPATSVITGTVDSDDLGGATGDDRILGLEGADRINYGSTTVAGEGHDTLIGGAGSDTLFGGAGNDVIHAFTEQSEGPANTPLVQGGITGDWLDGGTGNDLLVGSGGMDGIFGGSGADTISAGDGNDVIYGDAITSGLDARRSFQFGAGAVGDDIHRYALIPATVQIPLTNANGGDDVIMAGAGNDLVYSDRGHDYVEGNAGDDYLMGDVGNDTLIGGENNDTLMGDGYDVETGVPYLRRVLGNEHGNDLLIGGQGNDLLYGNGGHDRLFGGEGEDNLFGDDRSTPREYHGNDYLDGGAQDDVLFGLGGDDTLHGGADNDKLFGDSNGDKSIPTTHGADYLDGGEGNDTLYGDGGDDVLLGGNGNDWLSGDDDYASDGVSQVTGNDTLLGGAGSDSLLGGNGNDHLDGGADADFLFGGHDDDILLGGDGNDHLEGGEGADSLTGGLGDDVMLGGAGNDTLQGGGGCDVLLGGAGDDLYLLTLSDMQIAEGLMGRIDDSDGHSRVHLLDIARENLRVRDGGGGNLVLQVDAEHQVQVDRGLSGASLEFQFSDGQVSLDRLLGEALLTRVVRTDTTGAGAVYGGAADDTLTVRGAGGGATISGGQGDDNLALLASGGGTLLFSAGDGRDTLITETADIPVRTGENTLRLGEGIALSDLRLSKTGIDSYALSIGVGGDAILFDASGATELPRPFDRVVFSDGAEVSWQQLLDSGIHVEVGDLLVRGTQTHDLIAGSARDRRVEALAGNDRLESGTGNETLEGGRGDDTYLFNAGFGRDTVDNQGALVGEVDRIVFGEGLARANARFIRHDDHLLVWFDQGDRLQITGFFSNQGEETLEFSDGQVFDRLNPPFYEGVQGLATEQADQLTLGAGDDQFDALAGNDSIFGGDGNDRLLGGAGDDHLEGEAGDDWLAGGTGNDYLAGGVGVDTYEVFATDSRATITRIVDPDGGNQLIVGGGLRAQDVRVVRDQQSATLRLLYRPGNTGAYSVVRLENQLRDQGASAPIALVRFEAEPGVTWSAADLLRMALTGGAGDDVIYGLANAANTLRGGAGNDHLLGGALDDQLDGEAGNDWLLGGAGNDRYTFSLGSGNDRVTDMEGLNWVELASGLTPDDIQLVRTGAPFDLMLEHDSLVLMLRGSGESLVLEQFFKSGDAETAVHFADGTVWNHAELGLQAGSSVTGLADTQTGGAGDDEFRVDNPLDLVVELDNGGTDVILSSVSYRLPVNVENLQLTGILSIDATGNNADNVLRGNAGDNRLDGLQGYNTYAGGGGNDTYVIRDNGEYQRLDLFSLMAGLSFSLEELAGEGVDTIETNAFVMHMPEQVEHLQVTSLIDVQRIEYRGSAGDARFEYTGNALNNRIDLSGTDFDLFGILRSVRIDGGAGTDTMLGSNIEDTYVVDDVGDVIIERGNAIDTVESQLSWRLGDMLENLLLTGDDATDGVGNALDNVLNSAENGAVNRLRGLAGDDTYLIGLNDIVVEAAGEGTDTLHLSERAGDTSTVFHAQQWANIEVIKAGDKLGLVDLIGDDCDNSLYGNYSSNLLEGGAGNDILYGVSLRYDRYNRLEYPSTLDRFFGGDGDDRIYAFGGYAEIDGGAGADLITLDGVISARVEGGSGNDLIRLTGRSSSMTLGFGLGSGQDTVMSSHTRTAAGWQQDKSILSSIVVAADTQASSLRFTREGADILVSLQGSTDSLRIAAFYENESSSLIQSTIDSIRLASGTLLNRDALAAGVGRVEFSGATETDDLLIADEAGAVLSAGAGNDYLAGQGGGDTLIGGAGNDYLIGGAGTDAFLYSHGWGNDTLDNRALGLEVISASDAIVFDDTVLLDDLIFKKNGENLLIIHRTTLDSILVLYSSDDLHSLPTVRFSDGTVLSQEQLLIRAFSQFGTEEDDVLNLDPQYDRLLGLGGNDRLNGDGLLDGGDGHDTLVGSGVLIGGNDDDHITGTGGSDLQGGDGDDLLVAYDDTSDPQTSVLEGGAGNDTLYGSFGNDTYVFNLGDGSDLLIERRPDQAYGNVAPSFDELLFGEGIDAADLSFVRQGFDLLIAHANGSDQILVQNWFRGPTEHFKLNSLYFADGSELSQSEIESLVVYRGTAAADSINGSDQNDTVYVGAGDDQVWAGSGDDRVYGEAGSDYLDGQAGDDTLYGDIGNDQLMGGAGNDQLFGGTGDDKYVYKPGDGVDTIDTTGGGTDGVFFSGGIDETRLTFTRDGDDLLILVDEDAEQSVRVLNHFLGGDKAISYVQPDGGLTLTATRIAQIVAAGDVPAGFDALVEGTAAGEQLAGGQARDLLRGLAGNDTLFGMGGNDQIEGGDGNDYLSGGNGSQSGSGDDILIGGIGDDVLDGEDGDDQLTGGAGDDKYYYRANGGVDVIDNSGGGFDGAFFIGITRTRLSFHREGDDLLILVDGDFEQQVKVTDHFLGGDFAIDYVQPDGGSYITTAQIAGLLTALPDGGTGEPGDGGTNPGGGGQPQAAGIGGDDVLTGTAANDVLIGGAGLDTLNGGAGNDQLLGGVGDDTYVYTAGQDLIEEIGGADTLEFVGGITFNQVASGLMKSGNDLILQVGGSTANQVKLKDFFLGSDNLVETIAFETGGQLTAAQIFGAFGLAVPTPAVAFDDSIQGLTGDDAALDGTAGNDLLQGGNGDDGLFGDAGNDRLEGGNADDILDGGTGNDTLVGGRGDDTYIFVAGSGHDVIDNSGGGADTLHFEGISFNQAASGLMKSGNDLVFNVSGGSDKVTISNWFLGGDYVMDSITFASGGQLTAAQLFGAFGVNNPDPVGSPAYQNLPDERSFGTVLAGQVGDQIILGSSDDDMIDGGVDNDTLRGNAGSDYLIGGAGSDTYMFALGDGQDVINNLSNTPDIDTDVLSIEGIVREDLWLSRNGSDLVIDVSGSEDSITIQDWYADSGQQLDVIQSSGSSLYANQVDSLVNAMAAFGVPAGGEIDLTPVQRDQLNVVIAANWQ